MAADARDHADLEHLRRVQWRQDADQARRQHRLAGPGRPHQHQVVGAGGGDLQRPLRGLLALDVAQVGIAPVVLGQARLGRLQELRAAGVVDQREQAGGRQDLDLVLEPGRLRAAGGRADQAEPALGRRHRRRQHAGDRTDAAVQRQLAQHQVLLHRVDRQHAHDDQHAQGDGQIEVAALLGEIGRRQVDDDPARRQCQAHRTQGRPHPLTALGHRLVRQADDREAGQTAGDLDLDVDRGRVQPEKGHRAHPGDGEGGGGAGHDTIAPS